MVECESRVLFRRDTHSGNMLKMEVQYVMAYGSLTECTTKDKILFKE